MKLPEIQARARSAARQAGLGAAAGALLAMVVTAGPGVRAQGSEPAWNQWRGPARDGRLGGFTPPAAWPAALGRRWTLEVGEGHASPLLAGDSAYVFSREEDQEVARRVRLDTGREAWKVSYAAPYEMHPAARGHGKGPKSTPLLAGDRLFTLGISGILSCLDAATGAVRWRRDFSREYPKTSPLYGAAMSPLLVDGTLIVHVGGHDGGALTAFEAETGAVRWRWTGDGPAYSSPILVTLDGVRQVVTQTQKLCAGFDLETGTLLWSLPYTTPYDQNSVTPVSVGETLVFGGTRRPTIGCRVRREGGPGGDWKAEKIWETGEATLYMSTPVLDGGRLYGVTERRSGQAFTLHPATGEVLWTGDDRLGANAAVLDAGPLLLVLTTNAELIVYRKEGQSLARVARYQVAESPTWATPAISGSRILVKDAASLILWEIPR